MPSAAKLPRASSRPPRAGSRRGALTAVAAGVTLLAAVAMPAQSPAAAPEVAGAPAVAAGLLPATAPPALTTAPHDATVAAGGRATFHASATGNPVPTVQWQVQRTRHTPWASIAGADRSTFTTGRLSGPDDGFRYRARFSNPAGSVVTPSATVRVRVTLRHTNLPRTVAIRTPTWMLAVRVVLSSNVGSVSVSLRNNRGILTTVRLRRHGSTDLYTSTAHLRRTGFPGTVHDHWIIRTTHPGRTYSIPVTIYIG